MQAPLTKALYTQVVRLRQKWFSCPLTQFEAKIGETVNFDEMTFGIFMQEILSEGLHRSNCDITVTKCFSNFNKQMKRCFPNSA